MIQNIKKKVQARWLFWVIKRARKANPQKLTARTIYILPSGFGWAYSLVVLSLFTGAINYQISTVFLMTFLLALIGLVSAWEAHANLLGLAVHCIGIDDVPQGQPALLNLFFAAQSKKRFAVALEIAQQEKIILETISVQGCSAVVPIATTKRGVFTLPLIKITCLYPLGIFKVWAYLYFEEQYYVYPKPCDPGFWPQPIAKEWHNGGEVLGQDELCDLKQVEDPWSEPNRIAWKIAAKGQGWYHKVMYSSEDQFWHFRLSDLPYGTLEKKLEHMSYWIQSADSNEWVYGMTLGAALTPCAKGKAHLKHLLRELALYQ